MRPIRKIVVLGANGAMGSGSGAVFASAGIPTVFLARTLEKAEAGRARAEQLPKGKVAAEVDRGRHLRRRSRARRRRRRSHLRGGRRGPRDQARGVRADRQRARAGLDRRDGVVGPLDRGDVRGPQRRLPQALPRRPPVQPADDDRRHASSSRTPSTDRERRRASCARCSRRRSAASSIECADTPAFAGNRIGFKVLNEVAQLAEEHGVAYMDQLVGPHTGRALAAARDDRSRRLGRPQGDRRQPPREHARRGARVRSRCPRTCSAASSAVTSAARRATRAASSASTARAPTPMHFVLDPTTGDYRPLAEVKPPMPAFVERMKAAIKRGQPPRGVRRAVPRRGQGRDAAPPRDARLHLATRSAASARSSSSARDVDRIMGFGFNWAPPSVLVDAIGAARTIELLDREASRSRPWSPRPRSPASRSTPRRMTRRASSPSPRSTERWCYMARAGARHRVRWRAAIRTGIADLAVCADWLVPCSALVRRRKEVSHAQRSTGRRR